MEQFNLIRNSKFKEEAVDWIKINDKDILFSNGQVEILRGKNDTDTVSIFSSPITVNSQAQYVVSFDVWVEEVSDLDSADFAVILRAFGKPEHINNNEAIFKWYPSLKKHGIESGIWLHIEEILTFPDSFLRAGIWFKTGHVKVNNLSLIKLSKEILFKEDNGQILYDSHYQLKNPVFLPLGQLELSRNLGECSLNLDIHISDISGFFTQDSFFALIQSDKVSNLSISDFNSEDIQKVSINFENITSNKWKHIDKLYKLNKKHIAYGILLSGKGQVAFKNIDLRLL